MPDVTYEIMLLSPIAARGLRPGVWYLDSAHEGLSAARTRFAALAEEHPDDRLQIVLLESRHDAESGLYRDRIVSSRGGPCGSLFRPSAELNAEARRAIKDRFGARIHQARPQGPRAARRPGGVEVAGAHRRNGILAAAAVIAATTVLLLVRSD